MPDPTAHAGRRGLRSARAERARPVAGQVRSPDAAWWSSFTAADFRAATSPAIRGKPAVTAMPRRGRVVRLASTIAFARHAPIQDILRDAARAIQFFAAGRRSGTSTRRGLPPTAARPAPAPACGWRFTTTWPIRPIADPVLRQSTRLTAAGSLNGQASYDLRDWRRVWSAPRSSSAARRSRWRSTASVPQASWQSPAADKMMKDCSMIGLITADDPPGRGRLRHADGPIADRGHYLHHPKHSTAHRRALQSRRRGVPCCCCGHERTDDNPRQDAAVVAFLIEKVKAAK